jgi:hypothetical protein
MRFLCFRFLLDFKILNDSEKKKKRGSHPKKGGMNFVGLPCDFDQQFCKCLGN